MGTEEEEEEEKSAPGGGAGAEGRGRAVSFCGPCSSTTLKTKVKRRRFEGLRFSLASTLIKD